MHKSSLVVAAWLLAAVYAEKSGIQCAKGLKMFVSRGTGEPMGLGATGDITKVIAERIPGSHSESIPYPASETVPSYMVSVATGTGLLREAIEGYVNACPNSKIAVFGYSQGAQITSNNFCGTPAFWSLPALPDLQDPNELLRIGKPLSKEVSDNVISVVLFGDTTHVANAPYNHGTWNNTGNGIFYRDTIQACEALGPRIRSYCDAGDPFCDVGTFLSATAHLEYAQLYGEEVAKFVVQQYKSHQA